ncbi:hypothetical protein HRbin29_01850 [bacterium HR29]|jgi:hypothetical protein|nr:hypothetical protein HRbin29_01850 [bacterium HR29]
MVDIPALPAHVAERRRDGRIEVLLHRSVALISPERIEVKSARSTVWLPLLGIAATAAATYYLIVAGLSLPFWALVTALLLLLLLFPVSVMGLIGALVGADVVADARKGSVTFQQGFLGMGIGTKELVPFAKVAHLEIVVEGDTPDRWRGHTDDLRQFTLLLVKTSGKRLSIATVPVPAFGQLDGMDRTLAVGQALAALIGTEVRIPEGWELVEVDAETGEPLPRPQRRSRRRTRSRGRH